MKCSVQNTSPPGIVGARSWSLILFSATACAAPLLHVKLQEQHKEQKNFWSSNGAKRCQAFGLYFFFLLRLTLFKTRASKSKANNFHPHAGSYKCYREILAQTESSNRKFLCFSNPGYSPASIVHLPSNQISDEDKQDYWVSVERLLIRLTSSRRFVGKKHPKFRCLFKIQFTWQL